MDALSPDTVPTSLGPLHVQALGSGPVAVLWHSLFVDSTTWERLIGPLSARRRLILIDGPSHGRSAPAQRLFTLDECAAAAVQVLDNLGIDEPVDWVGNAWGGHVGILFAAAHPDRVRSLTAIGTPLHALRSTERRRNGALVALYRAVGPLDLLAKPVCTALLGPDAQTTDPNACQLVANAFRRPDRKGMYLAMRSAMLRRQDLTETVRTMNTRTLIATGAGDHLWTPEQARAEAAQMPNATAATVPGAGHVAPLLQGADAVATLLAGFWQETRATR